MKMFRRYKIKTITREQAGAISKACGALYALKQTFNYYPQDKERERLIKDLWLFGNSLLKIATTNGYGYYGRNRLIKKPKGEL